MNWYLQSGKESDVVQSTRIRLARNLKEYPFKPKCSKQDLYKILEIMEKITPSIGYGLKFIKLANIDDITKLSLVEKHIISPEFALSKESDTKAIIMNDEENICIMINEEDHIRIQIFSSGLELENCLNLAIEIDEKIGKLVSYAVNDKYGYLTECPTNVGTGLRASVMVHLPALTITRNINKTLEIINGVGMNIRGVYGEGSETQGNMYQISNKQSLGITEKEMIKNIRVITDKIIEQERLARKYLGKNSLELEDKVYRSYGILTNARVLNSEETRMLLSDVKLGTDLGIIKELDDFKVNKLFLYTKPANLQKVLGEQLDSEQRDKKRREIIKQIIKE